MGNLSKNFGKLTIPLLVLLAISFSALPALGQYGGGTGEPNDPYLISTPAQMNTIGAMLLDYDKHFRLMANIDLSGYTGTSFFIIGIYPDYPFTGVFDGNGHTISNFTYTSTATNHIGIFGYVAGPGAEIKDLGLINPDVDAGSGDRVGSLVGRIEGGSISNCYVDGGSVSGGYTVGGLVGRGGRITNCHSSGIVSGTGNYIGGLVGLGGAIRDCWSAGSVYSAGVSSWTVGGLVGSAGTVSNCYSTASVSASGSNEVGGLAGYGGQIFNSYATGNVSGGDYAVGGLVGRNWFDGVVFNCYSTGSVSGTGTDVGGLVGWNGGMVSASFWDIQTSGRSTSSGGTPKTTAQMQDINTFLSAGWDFVNQADGPSDDWAEPPDEGYMILWWQLPEGQLPALPTFSGGTGEPNDPYLISTASELNRIGHNPRLMAASPHFKLINDIDLAGVDFFFIGNPGYDYSGIFDGNGHRISNFTYSSTGASYIGHFGAIRGKDTEVKDLGLIAPNVDAGAGSSIGSLVGLFADGTVSGCYVDGGSVSGDSAVGGLVGRNNYGTITDCYASGSVSGYSEVGGLVGLNYYDGTITNSYATGIVSGDLFAVGGLAGSNHGIITDCYSSCDVSGRFVASGLVGLNEYGTVTNSYATGSVSGDETVGGLVGGGGGMVTNCYATGSVSGGSYVGGLVGSGGSATNCYSTGSVSGSTYVGGLVGITWDVSIITNCYSAGSVTGDDVVGGLVGYDSCYLDECGSITNSYWDIETSGEPNMCGSQDPNGTGCDNANGKTTAEMQTASTFTDAGWDFVGERINGSEDIWMMTCEGMSYPKLNWWQPVLGDYFCPDGVDMIDMEHLALHWLDTGCDETNDYCDWAEISNDSTIDFTDFAILADNWLAGL